MELLMKENCAFVFMMPNARITVARLQVAEFPKRARRSGSMVRREERREILLEEADSFGILAYSGDGVSAHSASTACVIAASSASDRDKSKGAAADGNGPDGTAAQRQ